MFPDGLIGSTLKTLAYGAGVLGLLFAAVVALEACFGGDVRRHRSRNFATDLAYALMYLGGIYNLVIWVPVLYGISLLVPDTWHLNALRELPPVLGFFAYWLIADFLAYWLHRSLHHFPLLWRVHRVHHAQTVITYATSWRNHVLEQLYMNLMMYVPLMLLGMPTWFWLPLVLVQYLFEALQHADLDWRYGPLYPVLVSPVFHAIHHAPERARHDGNYGKILSLWDRLFGTVSGGPRPARFGLEGAEMPPTFWASMVAPFRPATSATPPATPVAETQPAGR
jgi:sterol desaturase/sphingolipid hydroxylase (fatty acid hydroxylase superfamily)